MSYDALLEEYHISSRRGFVLENPVTNLDDERFQEWIDLCKSVTDGTDFGTVSSSLASIEDFDIRALKTHEERRYAKLLLETIVQGYLFMHINAYEGEDLSKVPESLPPSIARPFLELSELLGMKPVVSHGSITLANVKLANGKENAEFVAENLELIMPRTYLKDADTEGYSWFFRVSAEIEASFAPAIHSIGSICFHRNNGKSTVDLDEALTSIIESCEKAKQGFKKYRVNLTPRVFYYEVRPCLWGYDQLPNGVKFGEDGEAFKYRGASASESTSMQVIDAFLNVSYSAMQKEVIIANRAFMPTGHRKFIEFIEEAVTKDDGSLFHRIQSHSLFPSAMKALRDLRSEHVNIVTLFVVTQMKDNSQAPVSQGKMLLGFIKSFRDACVIQEKTE